MSLGGNKPKTLGDLLSDLIESKGWKEKLDEQKLPDIWRAVVGDKIAEVTRIGKLEEGVLTIITNSSTWRSEIKLREQSLIKSINEKLEKELIREFRIK